MSKDQIFLSDEQIREITYHIQSLSPKEREKVIELLHRIKSGGIWRNELHRELYKLRQNYTLSETDMSSIEKIIFEE